MKLRHYTIIATLALLTASCAHEESEVAQISDVQVVIEASFTDIASETKATTTAFESGDLLGLYAVKSGGELNAASNIINNHQLKVAESGAIVGDLLPAYYPDKSSSLDLFSYYPYQSGNATADALGVLVGIRTHQADFSSLMASDLCYGQKLDAAPSAAPHPLQFRHSFAQLRLNFSLYEGCSAISAVKLLAIKDSAKLNLQTGLVTLLTSSVADVEPFVGSLSNSADATNPLQFTAIIPAQSLSGACVEITLTDGTIYYYHATAPIPLKESATNTLNLTLSDKGKLTLDSTPAITAWGVESTISNISESTDNAFTFYWSPAITSFGSIDKAFVTLTNPATKKSARIEVTSFVRDATSTAANAIFRFAITRTDAASIGYPVTIDKFELFNGGTAVHTLTDYYGRTVTRSGAHTFGTVTSIKLSETTWNNVSGYGDSKTITVTTTGNVEWTATSNNAALTVTKSGNTATLTWAPYFSASALGNRTATVTFETNPKGASVKLTTTQNQGPDYVIINGLKWTTGNLVASGTDGCKIGAPTDGGLYFQFGSLLGWKGGATGDGAGRPSKANGTFYVGSSFNAANEIAVKPSAFTTIANIGTTWPNQTANLYYFGLSSYATNYAKLRDFSGFTAGTLAPSGVGDACRYYLGGTWRLPTAEEHLALRNASTVTHTGIWSVQSTTSYMQYVASSQTLQFPASGGRDNSDGAVYGVGERGYGWSESVGREADGYFLHFHSSSVFPQDVYYRRLGFPVRCVSN